MKQRPKAKTEEAPSSVFFCKVAVSVFCAPATGIYIASLPCFLASRIDLLLSGPY